MEPAKLVPVFLFLFIIGAAGYGGYEMYHYMSSADFCGKQCHQMYPYYETYVSPANGTYIYAHAREHVLCDDCHTEFQHGKESRLSKDGLHGFIHDQAISGMIECYAFFVKKPHLEEIQEHAKTHDLVPTDRCLTCHPDVEALTQEFPVNPHEDTTTETDCEGCHPGHEMGGIRETCGMCHEEPVQLLEEAGGLHSNIDCVFCHEEHAFIPLCQDCHGDLHGSQYSNCEECHTNAHAPKAKIHYAVETPRSFCTGCHEVKTLLEAGGKHSKMACAACHPEHAKVPWCTDCHAPHSGMDSAKDCEECHEGHQPNKIHFEKTVPKTLCRGCHEETYDKLVESKTAHNDRNCSYCHPMHAFIPQCDMCHGLPHGSGYKDCNRCHGDPHDVRMPEKRTEGGH